jgi:NADH:ubiquinone oxidoreductase subunit 3 (subunit A)
MSTLLTPPIAFLVYLLLGVLISRVGRSLAGPSLPNALKSSTYASGEAAPLSAAAPGYGPNFVTALFFGVLHLGILVVATSNLSISAGLFLLGLVAALLVLLLG